MHENIKKENELKKEYLKSYGDAVRAEKAIEDEIQQLRLDRMFPSVVIDDMPHGSGGCSDLSGYAAKVDELLEELRQSMEERIELRREIVRKIEAVPIETEKLVLRLRYIQGEPFEKIAVDLSYTYRHVTRLHGQALRDFKLS